MKINCACGHQIIDGTDEMPNKAHVLPDQGWGELLDAIDAAIEQSGPTAADKDSACRDIRTRLSKAMRLAWQCSACGSLYVDDARFQAWRFAPSSDDSPKNLFGADEG
jgi:hypothetical protein